MINKRNGIYIDPVTFGFSPLQTTLKLTGYDSLCALANLRACTNLCHELLRVTSHIQDLNEIRTISKWSLLKTPRSKGESRGFTECGSSCVRKSCKCELLNPSMWSIFIRQTLAKYRVQYHIVSPLVPLASQAFPPHSRDRFKSRRA